MLAVFISADCDTDLYLVVAKVTQISYVEDQSKKVNGAEGKEQYHVEISNAFKAEDNLDTEVWTAIRKNVKISAKESLGYYELKKHKSWFDEGC
jgi:hypothetical protein